MELEELEVIHQYGGWDDTRDDEHYWVRLDQVREIIKEKDGRIDDLTYEIEDLKTQLADKEEQRADAERRAWDSGTW